MDSCYLDLLWSSSIPVTCSVRVSVDELILSTDVPVSSGSSRKDVQMLFPEEEKIIIEETKSNGQTVVEER